MDIRQLTTAELGKAREAADYLCQLPASLDSVLTVKLDTLRADLTAAIEDREHADTTRRPALSQVK